MRCRRRDPLEHGRGKVAAAQQLDGCSHWPFPPRSMAARQCAGSSRMVSGALTTIPTASAMVKPAAACARAAADARSAPAGTAGGLKEVSMKLYFAPGACSLSPHIVMREAGVNLDLEQVNNQEKKTKSGVDYWTINAKGQVPVLEFDNGERLTEGPVIVQWIADQNPASGLVPPAGKLERYRVQECSTSSRRSYTRRSARSSGPPPPTRTRPSPRRTWASASTGSTSSLPASST